MDVMFISKLRKPASMNEKEFYGAWLAESQAAISALDAGRMKFIYKIAGEFKIVGIIEVDKPESLDRVMHNLPIFKGGNMDMVESYEWIMLADYRDWALQLELLAQLHVDQ